ncbi:hypothetical protein HK405_016069, partial [Cladochytrium tenue]
MGVRSMFDDMYDIAQQLVLKFERFGPDYDIDITKDFTRLTLDTIALAAFSYRFNSFYSNEMHPFVDSMVNALTESGVRGRRLPFQNFFMSETVQQFDADVAYIHDLCDKLVRLRRKNPVESHDLLNQMLNGKDKNTGLGLSDENIRYQLVTFLIAGHETTSGLLSFAFFLLGQNPNILRKVQEEVDRVTEGQPITVAHIPKFTYINAVLRETLRLYPTAPAFGRGTKDGKPFELPNGYLLEENEVVFVALYNLHRDPDVWSDPESFKPERFLDGEFEKLPPNCYKPFGAGERACIGRAFAMQEAILVTAMILQRFDIELSNPSLPLRIKETLTIKPEGVFMR